MYNITFGLLNAWKIMMKQYSNTCQNCLFITQDVSFRHYYK